MKLIVKTVVVHKTIHTSNEILLEIRTIVTRLLTSYLMAEGTTLVSSLKRSSSNILVISLPTLY